jgi:hypothetical protein
MGTKLSAKAQERIDFLDKVAKKLDRLHSLTEQLAAAKSGGDQLSSQIARECQQLRQGAIINNLGPLADAVGQMGMAVKRGGSPQTKARALREGMSSARPMVERLIKATLEAEAGEK